MCMQIFHKMSPEWFVKSICASNILVSSSSKFFYINNFFRREPREAVCFSNTCKYWPITVLFFCIFRSINFFIYFFDNGLRVWIRFLLDDYSIDVKNRSLSAFRSRFGEIIWMFSAGLIWMKPIFSRGATFTGICFHVDLDARWFTVVSKMLKICERLFKILFCRISSLIRWVLFMNTGSQGKWLYSVFIQTWLDVFIKP